MNQKGKVLVRVVEQIERVLETEETFAACGSDGRGFITFRNERPGQHKKRLKRIWDIYMYMAQAEKGCNNVRTMNIAWDLSHIFAAIAGGYVIELSPQYVGVRMVRKNKELWKEVSKFVSLRAGRGCLPFDHGSLWEEMNSQTAHEIAERTRLSAPKAKRKANPLAPAQKEKLVADAKKRWAKRKTGNA